MGKKKIQSIRQRTVACVLSAAMIVGSYPAIPAYATGTDGDFATAERQQIVDMVGNAEMKALGESIESGSVPKVTDADTPAGAGTTYYVDAENGDDTYAGTSEVRAWKTFEKVNSVTFQPGDRILLKAGCEWENATLNPQGSGEEGNPIILSSYGEGNMPKISANGQVGEAVLLMNQEYWDISNLDLSNTAEGLADVEYVSLNDTNGSCLGDYRGLRVAGQDAGQLDGYYIHNLYVHDVTGEDAWIGGSGEGSPGITKKNGWDKSKRTGGIVFEICQPETTVPTTFNDVTVENNVLTNNSFAGIIVKQWNGDKAGTNELWASREKGKNNAPTYACDNWNPHTNIVIQDNYMSQKDSDYACNTIYLTSTKDAVVQNNISNRAGTCAIEMYYTDNVIVQYNDIYDTVAKAGGADSNAIDPDKCATNTMIQYNYIHDTGDGILLCGFIFGSAVVRYNVIQDAEKRYLNPHGDKGVNYVYNNIFYNTKESSHVPFVESSGGSNYLNKTANMHYLYNNVFYNAAGKTKTVGIGTGTGMKYDSNSYFGTAVEAVDQDENAVTMNPLFMNWDISGAKKDKNQLANLQLQAVSSLIGAGKQIEQDTNLTLDMLPETDFFGNAVSERTDIGIAQYQIAEGKGVVNGYVTDRYGYLAENAIVTMGDKSVETSEQGYYSFGETTIGDAELTVSKADYDAGKPQNIEVKNQQVLRQNLVLGESLSDAGTVSGTVANAKGGIQGAVVTVTLGEQIYTATTDSTGAYTVTNVPVAQGYVVTAQKDGYMSASKENVAVRPGGVVVVDITLTKDMGSTDYKLNVDFDDYEAGDFSGNDEWAVEKPDAGKGNLTIVEEENGNKYLQMTKTDNGNIALYNKNEVSVEGIVTIEARIKRTKDGGNANQFGMYSFNREDWNASNPVTSSNPMATFALTKGNIISHNKRGSSTTVTAGTYELNQWYIVRNVVNLDTGTYDFYIDDMDTPVLSGQDLRTAKNDINRFLFYSNNTNTGDICIDYFRVCVGAPYDYDDTELISLTAEGVELTMVDNQTWTGNVEASVESVKVLPTAGSRYAQVKVGEALFDGTNAVEVKLQDGTNTIPVVVTAEDGTTTQEYTLIIHRASSETLAYLESLAITETALEPEFSPDILEYTATTTADIIHLELTAGAGGAVSKITVNGTAQDTKTEAALEEGQNIIEVEVNSKDGTSNEYYSITVTKETSVMTVNKTALAAMIETAETLNAENFTAATWNVLQEKLAEAREIMANETANQETVDEAYWSLAEAYTGLEYGMNTSAADALIEEAEAMLQIADQYQPESIEAVRMAMQAVKEALAAEETTQEQLNTLTLELQSVLMQLQKVDVSRLQRIVEQGEKILENEDKYTESSAATLKDVLQKAYEVLENEERTGEMVDGAYAEVTLAIAKLVLRGNKDVLLPFLERAGAILGESGKYTPTTLEGLREAVEAAQKVYDDNDAVQKEVNDAATALAAELAQVRLLGDVNFNGSVDTSDTVMVLKVNAEMEILDADAAQAADLNGDGVIDTSDAVQIQKIAAELIE